MSEQQQVSRQDYFNAQQLESLARQNAQQAMRISQLEAELLTLKAEMQQAQNELEPAPVVEGELIPGEDPIQSELEMPDIEH